jgi:hypothetical protein
MDHLKNPLVKLNQRLAPNAERLTHSSLEALAEVNKAERVQSVIKPGPVP